MRLNVSEILKLTPIFAYLILGSCSKSSDTTTSSSLAIPKLTAAVSGSASTSMGTTSAHSSMILANVHQSSDSGILLVGNQSSIQNSQASMLHSMTSSFMTFGKVSDAFSCMIEVLVKNGLVKTDGTPTVLKDDQNNQFKLKFVVNAAGTTFQNFKMFVCNQSASQTSNDQYVSGSMDGQNATFTMKFSSSGIKGSLGLTGVWGNSSWDSKSLTMELGASSSVSKFQIAQSSSAILIKGTFDSLTSATNSDAYAMYGKYALSGDAPSTYRMGQGSAKYKYGSSAEVLTHWDAAGANASSSIYSSDVTSASYFEAPLTFGGDLTSEETWNCEVGSNQLVQYSGVDSSVSTSLQACTTSINGN